MTAGDMAGCGVPAGAMGARRAMVRRAAIDIGTVTCRLMVADVDGADIRVIERGYEVTNLGEGVDATGRISEAAIERVAHAVDGFLRARDALSTPEHPVVSTTVMSTSAARDAKNAAEFADMLARRGLHLEVITGDKEAELTFRGVVAGLPLGTKVAVVDVGGGSTEVSFGEVGCGLSAARSFDIGCRRMTERFFRHDPPLPLEVDAAMEWATSQFQEWAAQLPFSTDAFQLFAVAGTATSAISMREEMRVYDSERVHGARMDVDQLEQLAGRLAAMTEREREQVTGLDPKRAPVIVAGLLILTAVLRSFGFGAFTASESDILQGMLSCAAEEPVRSGQVR